MLNVESSPFPWLRLGTKEPNSVAFLPQDGWHTNEPYAATAPLATCHLSFLSFALFCPARTEKPESRLVSGRPHSYFQRRDRRTAVQRPGQREEIRGMIELIQTPWSPFCLVQKRILEFSGQRFKITNVPP